MLSSRERMLLAINCHKTDYIPLSFMIFSTLRSRCKDQYEFIDAQIEMGLDAFVDLPPIPPTTQSEHSDLHGLPVRFHSEVKIIERKEIDSHHDFPLLYKEYQTPAGNLNTIVRKVDDWKHGDHIPFFDDYLIPRSEKFLISNKTDLKSLEYLLTSPSKQDIKEFRETSSLAKSFSNKRDILVVGGWGVGMDAACWLCGIENLMLASIYEPDFVYELANIIARWNQERMEIMLDIGIDLFIRRGWYESADFWAPDLYRQFILPSLKKEAQMAHEAGAKFGYILTTSTMPLLDMLLESDIDVLIGVDPVQGRGTDLKEIKHKIGNRICIWGGINGFLTIELGTPKEIEDAVSNAINIMAPDGGFILSPVDNIRDTSEQTWKNVEFLIQIWKNLRGN